MSRTHSIYLGFTTFDHTPVVIVTAICVALSAVLLSAAMLGFGKRRFDVAGKHVYITGGSSGLGLALAKRCASGGANVTIVARDEGKLKEAVTEIKTSARSSSQVIQYVSADLISADASEDALHRAISHSTLKGQAPEYVFLCAGFAKPGFFLTTTEKDVKQGFDGVYWVAAWTAQAAGRLMAQQKKRGGKIIIVSSFMALTGFAGYSTYAPAKYALRGLAETLRSEFLLYGIDVHLYLPAGILSPGFETENKYKPDITKKIEEGDTPISPEDCVKHLVSGLEKGYFEITNDLVTDLMRVGGKAAAPGNNFVKDIILGAVATIGLPIWRWMTDSTIRNYAAEHQLYLDQWFDSQPSPRS